MRGCPLTTATRFWNRLEVWLLPQAPAKSSPSNPGRWSAPLLWKLGVSSVAERGIPGSFALTEESLAILFRDEGLGREIASTMRAVAERLASGFAATAEVIGLARLKFHTNGLTGCYLGFAHTLRTKESHSQFRSKSKNSIRG